MADHVVPLLGRLESVPIRSIWTSEPYAFDPWLSQPENLQFLAEALGLQGLELIQAQSPVGPFYADMVCRVVGTDQRVVIENQLDKADHRHLGQVLTYAPHHDARICVWVAAEICDEHRAAVDWLNRISNDDFSFFAVEVRAVRIGDSLPAPLFDVVAKPNNFSRLSSDHEKEAASAESDDNIAFWAALDAILEARGGIRRRVSKSVKGQNLWIPLTNDSAAYIVVYRAFSGLPQIGAYVGLYGDHRHRYWDALLAAKDQLEAAYPQAKFRWDAGKNGSVFKLIPEPLPLSQIDGSRERQLEWLADRIGLLATSVQPILTAGVSESVD